MSYELSFSEEFFTGDGSIDLYEIKPSDRPTSVFQAILSLDRKTQEDIARDVLKADQGSVGYVVDSECFPFDVLDVVRETNTCSNLDRPVRVWIDPEGDYRINVY